MSSLAKKIEKELFNYNHLNKFYDELNLSQNSLDDIQNRLELPAVSRNMKWKKTILENRRDISFLLQECLNLKIILKSLGESLNQCLRNKRSTD